MGVALRARVEAEFSLAGMLRRYDTLYLDVSGEAGVQQLPVPVGRAAHGGVTSGK